MNNKLTEEEIEKLALESAANMGASRVLEIPHPITGTFTLVDLDNPSEEAIEVLYLIYEKIKKA